MKKIIAINASPRTTWNTATLVREAARGAESLGAEVEVIDLYKLDKFTGCVSCFGCKLAPNLGKCVCRDALAPVLEKIRSADGLILGTPNYLGDVSAGFRALYERLVFPEITYKREVSGYSERKIPVLLIMTSNAPESFYAPEQPYGQLLARYKGMLDRCVGETTTFACGDTLQVSDYERYDWSYFDPEAKKARREAVFPQDKARVYALGAEMASNER